MCSRARRFVGTWFSTFSGCARAVARAASRARRRRVRALRSRARRVARSLSRYITRLRGYHDALALGEESYYHTPGKLREMQRRESECDGWMRECRAAWTDTIAAEDLAAARQANRTRRRLRWTAAHGSRLPSR